jgi:hypothetical protein
MEPHVYVRGKRYLVSAENLTLSTPNVSTQDGTAAVWSYFFKYTVGAGMHLGFKPIRESRFAIVMELLKNTTSAMDDACEVRILSYKPDGERQDTVIWKGTYGQIKNSTKYDLQKMIVANNKVLVPENYILQIEAKHTSSTIDVSHCSVDIGVDRLIEG